jgi:serine phosphatase RsbU (regulator of sigma subunit)
MRALPERVAEALYGDVLALRAVAWLKLDADGRVADAGGQLDRYGLDGVGPGDAASAALPVLDGLLPLAESPFLLQSIELVEGCAADLQCHVEGGATWVVLLDVTAERDATRRVQQRAYDMVLLQEKEARLNRQLEAANAALRATQADLERSQAALVQAYGRLEAELAEAAAYVRSILPAPIRAPFTADWRFVPSARLGGDCLGYHWIDAQHFAIYLLDVCGHGIGPSLLSVGALDTIRSQRLAGADPRAPGEVIATLNGLFQMERHNDLFFSLWYGVYRPAERRLAYASAGHPPALARRRDARGTARFEPLAARGALVGVMPGGRWATEEVTIAPGERLYVLSDGAFEVSRPDAPMVTYEEMLAFLEADAARVDGDGADDDGELDRLLAHLRREHGAEVLDDDFSIVRVAF